MDAAFVDGVLAEGAGEALLPQAHEEVEAEVAVGRPGEMLQPPNVMTVIFHVLQNRRING